MQDKSFDLSSMLPGNVPLRAVEPHIFSVLADNESGNEYDTPFGFIYDWVACNPVYNRLVWGYSIKLFSQTAAEALQSSLDGPMLDIGCGSLAFTAKTYCQYTGGRPVVLADQSLKMLRMAKARLIKQNGHVPDNLILLHTDARQIPFRENVFPIILSENLLHCLSDTGILLRRLKAILSPDGRMFFTTLVKAGRYADKYLEALAANGKLVSRTVEDHKETMERAGLSATYETTGNILVIRCGQ